MVLSTQTSCEEPRPSLPRHRTPRPGGRLLGGLVVALLGLAPATGLAGSEATIPDLYASSYSHEHRGSFDLAVNEMLQVLRIAPQDYVACLRAGWLNYQAGRFDDAVVHYRKAVQVAPRAVEARLGLLLPLMANLRWKEAEAVAREVLVTDPGNYLARSRLAWTLYSLGRFKEAETLYTALVEGYPGDFEMRLGLGWTLLKQGRKAEARPHFETVLRVDAHNLRARAGMEEAR